MADIRWSDLEPTDRVVFQYSKIDGEMVRTGTRVVRASGEIIELGRPRGSVLDTQNRVVPAE